MFLAPAVLVPRSASAARVAGPRWEEWGPAAFAEARASHRPVLLVIEASWDHWCHAMDREVFCDSMVAAVVQDRFVPVRVDRDLRPEIDRRYNAGGWPSVAALTPDGDIIRGGLLADAKLVGPALLQVSQFWRQNTDKAIAEAVAERQKRSTPWTLGPDTLSIPAADIARGAASLLLLGGLADTVRGGIGPEPKFPAPSTLRFALLAARELGDPRLLAFARTSLDSMSVAAIRDRVGGGFHRYSMTADWGSPVGEKLLATNAELLDDYALAFRDTGDPRYLAVARETADYLLTRLFDPRRHLFAAAEDADDYRGQSAGYYLWSADEIRSLLPGKEGELIAARCGFEAGASTSAMRVPLSFRVPLDAAAKRVGLTSEEAQKLEAKGMNDLRAARARQPRPAVIPTACVDANASAAAALMRLARLDPDGARYAATGREVVDALGRAGCDPSKPVPHYVLERGRDAAPRLLRDQVMFTEALLERQRDQGTAATLDQALSAARTLTAFKDPETGALLDRIAAPGDVPELAAPVRDIEENGRAAEVLLALAEMTGDAALRDAAVRITRAFLLTWNESMYFGGNLGIVAWRLHHPPLVVVIAGDPAAGPTRALRSAAESLPGGWIITEYVDPRVNRARLQEWHIGRETLPAALLVAGHSSREVASTPEALRRAALRFAAAAGS